MILFIIIIIIIILIIIIIKINRERLYFRLKYNNINNIDNPLQEINIENHYAIYYNNNNNNCILISHGNSSNIYNSTNLINNIKKKYNGDIYCYEYPGFGKCKNKLSIKNCVNEHLFWLDYLYKKYSYIDLWGYSIGGGIISQTVKHIPDNISNKINNCHSV